MRKLRFLVYLLPALWAAPAFAALDADVVVIYGSSWKRVLPSYAAAARAPKKGSEAAAFLPPIVLWTEGEEQWTEELLARLAPKKTVLIGPPGISGTPLRIPGKVQRIEAADEQIGLSLAEAAFSADDKPRAVWVADGVDVAAGIAAAALAASDEAPLLVATGDLGATVRHAGVLAKRLGAQEVVVVGAADQGKLATQIGSKVVVLDREQAVKIYNERVSPTRHLVTVAPSDSSGPFSPPKLSLGSLPYLLGKGAALAFVGEKEGGGRSPELAARDLEEDGGGPFDFVTIIGDTLAIPMQAVPDIDQVAKGSKNPRIHKVPSFVHREGGASDRAVGRLAALDVYDLSRWITRLLHDAGKRGDGNGVLVLANADEKFILGETISRTTSSELMNAGVRVESFYQGEITPELIKKELAGHALILWEGHPRDLTLDDDALPAPEEALPPATYFLQGCYTLDRSDPYVLVERGANAILGTYMAVYSASGSGFARAYLNSQIHEGATAGEAMTRARNYLLATVELKKRRGHEDWRKTLRAALSFDLWGDPTAPLAVATKRPKRQPVDSRLAGNRLSVSIPRNRLPTAAAGRYEATIRPGAELSALYHNEEDGKRRLSELFFVEVKVPEVFGDQPLLTSPYPDESYAWIFSTRTRTLSLLIHESALTSRDKSGTLHFTFESPKPVQPPG